jgi:heme-degrading monooxygenase HmoA
MVARVWVGITREAQAGDYLAYLHRTRVMAHREAEGNRGVFVLQRVCGGRAEFVLLSLWESMEATRKFSRGEFEKEVSYPADKDFLLEFDSKVTHYEVLVQP